MNYIQIGYRIYVSDQGAMGPVAPWLRQQADKGTADAYRATGRYK
jgi:hypothetical protein